MWFPLLLNLCQTVFSKLILFLFLKMPPFPPSLHCTEVLIKCWNVKVNSSASRLVTRLMWYLLTDSNQLYLTPRSFPPVLLLSGCPILRPQGPKPNTSASAPPWVVRKVRFQAQPAVPVCRNPHRTARSSSRNLASAFSLSALVSGGSPVADKSSYFPP